MSVALPGSIQVGPYRYTLTCSQAAIDRGSVSLQSRCAGYTQHHTLTMALEPELAPDYAAETVLHEVLHAVNHVMGLGEGKYSDEEFCKRVAPMLLDTLRRNPQLVAYLLATQEGTTL